MSDSENISQELFGHLYDKDQNAFERNLFGAFVYGEIPKASVTRVCSVHFNDARYRDFVSRLHNGLFIAYQMYVEMQGEGAKTPPLPEWSLLGQLCLIVATKHPELLSADDIPDLEKEWYEILGTEKNERSVVAAKGVLRAWLMYTRVRKEYNTANVGGALRRSPKALLNRLQKKVDEVDTQETPDGQAIFEWDDVPLHQESGGEKVSSGIPLLDRALGGGFHKKHAYLFLAITGGGKTTFTTQMAATFAILQDLGGILITTEDPPHMLRQRLVSHCCRMDWEKVRSDPEFTSRHNMTPKQAESYDEMNEHFRRNLMVVDWTMADNMVDDYDDLIRQYEERKGKKPDFILMDWIGGALEHATKDAKVHNGGELRHVYDAAAAALIGCCRKHNLVCIYNAQTNRSSQNKAFVTINEVGESFGITKGVAGVIGMSALLDAGEEDGSNLYKEDQILFVSKSRFGRGGKVQFRRKFEFQRLEPITVK